MVANSGNIEYSAYGIGFQSQTRKGLDFNRVITSARFGKIYEGQYTQDSNARIYGDIEKENISNENTVLLMHMDDDVTDATGNHSPSAVGSPTYVASKSGFRKAIDLDGSTQYISVANSSDFNFGSGDFTMEMLIKLNTGYITHSQHFLAYRDSLVNLGFDWRLTNGGGFTLRYANNSSSSWTNDFNNAWSPVAETWYHIAVSRSGSTLYFFVDGNLLGSHTIGTDSISSTADLYIGTGPYNSFAEKFDGLIDELRIVKGEAVYTSNFTPPTNPYSNYKYNLKFFADSENLYQIAEHNSIEPSGQNIPLIGSGVGVGLSGVFDYNIGV